MKQYKLINNKTNEEHFCEKITVDGYDYYVSDSEQAKKGTFSIIDYRSVGKKLLKFEPKS